MNTRLETILLVYGYIKSIVLIFFGVDDFGIKYTDESHQIINVIKQKYKCTKD